MVRGQRPRAEGPGASFKQLCPASKSAAPVLCPPTVNVPPRLTWFPHSLTWNEVLLFGWGEKQKHHDAGGIIQDLREESRPRSHCPAEGTLRMRLGSQIRAPEPVFPAPVWRRPSTNVPCPGQWWGQHHTQVHLSGSSKAVGILACNGTRQGRGNEASGSGQYPGSEADPHCCFCCPRTWRSNCLPEEGSQASQTS